MGDGDGSRPLTQPSTLPHRLDPFVDPFAFPPFALALETAYSAVETLSTWLTPFAGGSSAAFAIVLVTLAVRVALLPLGVMAARSAAAMRRIGPQLQALRTRHAKNPERLARETGDLMRRERVSPFGGFVPLLAQLPVVGIVYAVFTHPSIAGHSNGLLAALLIDVPLGRSLLSLVGGGLTPTQLGVLLAGLAALVVVAEVSRRWGARQQAALAAAQPARPATSTASGQAVRAVPQLPAWFGFLSYGTLIGFVVVPFAAGIFMAVSAAWGISERMVLARRFARPTAPTAG